MTRYSADSRDRVLVKSDGATTYLANDLAYHRDKLDRGFQHLGGRDLDHRRGPGHDPVVAVPGRGSPGEVGRT